MNYTREHQAFTDWMLPKLFIGPTRVNCPQQSRELDLKIQASEHHVPGFTSSPIEQLGTMIGPSLRSDHFNRMLLGC
jgi:hypothetical protein